jgi:argininosuccinate synthase
MKALLAYSGGLDTSAILVWLREELGYEVYCYCCDVGNQPDKEYIEKKALELGAKEFIFENVQNEFIQNYIYPLLRTGALYESEYLLGTAIARPLIAKRMSHFASKYGIDSLVHGATGKGNDQLRFEQAWAYLCPDLEVIAPWKTWNFKGRTDLIEYLNSKGYEYEGENKGKYSIDENIFHKSIEGGEIETIESDFSIDDLVGLASTEKPERIELEFEQGILSSINGKQYSYVEMLTELNTLGDRFKIGTIDIVEERVNGIKSRGIYQTPGGSILYFALKKLKEVCWGHKTTKLAQNIGIEYADLIYEGSWFSLARLSIEGFFQEASRCLSGSISINLKPYHIQLVSRHSPVSLYSEEIVSFEHDEEEINKAALGYSKTRCLPFKAEGRVAIHGK